MTFNLRARTKQYARGKVRPSSFMTSAMQIVAERETPTRQCTKVGYHCDGLVLWDQVVSKNRMNKNGCHLPMNSRHRPKSSVNGSTPLSCTLSTYIKFSFGH